MVAPVNVATWSSGIRRLGPRTLAGALADALCSAARSFPSSLMSPPADSAPPLPAAIGPPATRALLAAGFGDLAACQRATARELLALHGVGPKAVRLLAAALAERGWAFRAS